MRFRPVSSDDTAALYAVSLATGLAGADASGLHKDRMLVGHIYSAPYAQLEPSLALVVEDEFGVGGFAVGVVDTRSWEERLEREWWPSLRAMYPRPAGQPSEWSADERRAAMIHAPDRTPTTVSNDYPAHLHLNLFPRLQGQGVGSALLAEWLELAESKNAKALHVAVNRQNRRGLEFWSRHGFRVLTVEGGSMRTVWMGRSIR